jgi:hypothetical protein
MSRMNMTNSVEICAFLGVTSVKLKKIMQRNKENTQSDSELKILTLQIFGSGYPGNKLFHSLKM